MEKLSSQKVAQVLEDTRVVLLSVTEERDKLASEVASMKRHQDAEKLASKMHDKGVRMDTEHADLVVELEKAAEDGRFSVIEEAVEMVSPQNGFTTRLHNDDVAGGGGNAFESFILGNVG